MVLEEFTPDIGDGGCDADGSQPRGRELMKGAGGGGWCCVPAEAPRRPLVETRGRRRLPALGLAASPISRRQPHPGTVCPPHPGSGARGPTEGCEGLLSVVHSLRPSDANPTARVGEDKDIHKGRGHPETQQRTTNTHRHPRATRGATQFQRGETNDGHLFLELAWTALTTAGAGEREGSGDSPRPQGTQ